MVKVRGPQGDTGSQQDTDQTGGESHDNKGEGGEVTGLHTYIQYIFCLQNPPRSGSVSPMETSQENSPTTTDPMDTQSTTPPPEGATAQPPQTTPEGATGGASPASGRASREGSASNSRSGSPRHSPARSRNRGPRYVYFILRLPPSKTMVVYVSCHGHYWKSMTNKCYTCVLHIQYMCGVFGVLHM